MKRPNILFIQSDQHRFDCLGVNGHPRLETPSLDRLAAEGVNCDSAYTPIPLCSPARASMLTGCWPTRHGCIGNADSEAWQPPVKGLPICPALLRDTGYRTGYIGKWHVDKEKDPTHYGYEKHVPEGDYHRWRAAQGVEPAFQWKGFSPEMLFGRTDEAARPEQSRLAWGADRALDLIEEFSGAEDSRPWMVRWDPSEPHLPNVVPEPYASLYATGDLPAWPSFPDSLESKPHAQLQSRLNWNVQGWDWDRWQSIVARYLGEIALMDAQIGRVLAWLAEHDLVENTWVIYTSDHGDLCGAHGLMDKHFVMYDDVVRVPLIMRWPAGGISGGRNCSARIIHALDLPATMLSAAGICLPETFQGESILPWVRGENVPQRDSVLAMYHGNIFGLYSQRMVTDGRWKYIWNVTDRDEFYDLASDPGELVNRASDPSFSPQLTIWRGRLLKWMEAIQDPLLNPWHRRVLETGAKI